jgi:hypothetical protein
MNKPPVNDTGKNKLFRKESASCGVLLLALPDESQILLKGLQEIVSPYRQKNP